MKALLRFQAVVLARTFSNAGVLTLVAAAGVAAIVALTARGGGAYAAPASMVLGSFAVWGMASTFGAMDRLTWSSPARRAQVLRAHFLFWATVLGPPCAAAAVLHSKADAPASALLFLALMLLVGTAAANVAVFQRWLRSGTVDSAMPALALPLVTAVPAAWAILLASFGDLATSAVASSAVFVVAAAVATRLYCRDEFLPQATGPADPRDVLPDRRTTRTPARTLGTGSRSGLLWPVVPVVLALQCMPVPGWFPFPAFYVVLAVSVLATPNLGSCAWLFATPMERGRIFRRLFVPLALLATVAVAARIGVLEFRPDRTAFFDSFGSNPEARHHKDALHLGQVLRIRPREAPVAGEPPVEVLGSDGELVYASPEPEFMAARVREHLRAAYGLDVAAERIEGSIRRGWPEDFSPGPDGRVWAEQTAVFDAMDRVRADLSDDIESADRRRNLLCGAVVLLSAMTLLRREVAGGGRFWSGARSVLWVAWLAMCLTQIAPGSAAAAALTSVALAVEAPIQQASAPVAALLLLAVPAACFLLWKSAERAFRRLDVAELAAPRPSSWWQMRTAS
jgi:hypothetical protein